MNGTSVTIKHCCLIYMIKCCRLSLSSLFFTRNNWPLRSTLISGCRRLQPCCSLRPDIKEGRGHERCLGHKQELMTIEMWKGVFGVWCFIFFGRCTLFCLHGLHGSWELLFVTSLSALAERANASRVICPQLFCCLFSHLHAPSSSMRL